MLNDRSKRKALQPYMGNVKITDVYYFILS